MQTQMLPTVIPKMVSRNLPPARLPMNYELAKLAIAECDRIDECKDWADKSAALASYAKQVKDSSMQDAARRIMLRAKIRIGELLSEIPIARGVVGARTRGKEAKDAGLTAAQGYQYVSMANVPKARREVLIEQSPPVTERDLAHIGRSKRIASNRGVSEAYTVLGGDSESGFMGFKAWMRKHPAALWGPQVKSDEAEKIRGWFREIYEYLDELDQAMPQKHEF